MPFPQLDLRVRSVLGHEGDAALEALGLTGGRRAATEPAAKAVSFNDAAEDIEDPEPPAEPTP